MKNNISRRLSLAVSVLTLSGCASFSNLQTVQTIPDFNSQAPVEYRIHPGDVLDIKFFYSSDLNENVTVRPDGRISLQLVDDIEVEGMTPAELDEDLTSLYREALSDKQEISVIVKEFGDQRVYVAGEVGRPGEFPLRNKMTVFQAITAAGGFQNTARKSDILIIRQNDDGTSRVYRTSLSDGNMENIAATGSAHAHLMPRDLVYVPKSDIATANLAVDQYVRQLMLFNGINVGVSGIYELNDASNND